MQSYIHIWQRGVGHKGIRFMGQTRPMVGCETEARAAQPVVGG